MIGSILINEPADGWDTLERMLLRETVLAMYRSIICPVQLIAPNKANIIIYQQALSRQQNAFIIMAVNELGYTQDEVARILGLSQVAVQKRIKRTHNQLREREGYKTK